jgi:hypothetical protein
MSRRQTHTTHCSFHFVFEQSCGHWMLLCVVGIAIVSSGVAMTRKWKAMVEIRSIQYHRCYSLVEYSVGYCACTCSCHLWKYNSSDLNRNNMESSHRATWSQLNQLGKSSQKNSYVLTLCYERDCSFTSNMYCNKGLSHTKQRLKSKIVTFSRSLQ